MASESLSPKASGGVSVSMSELNPHFVCVLCMGYFVDATTITECMHTFCKSCIVNFLRTKRQCPRCETLLTKSRPCNSLRPDRVMQALVFKTVPGLFQAEMRRRIEFYQGHPHADYEQDVEDFQHYVFSPDDSVSLSIRYYNFREADAETSGSVVRYFRCPATVPVAVLKTLVKTKYRVPDPLRVELLYGDDRLLDTWTLMEVAYIYMWKRESPMELSFQVVATRKVKKRKPQSSSVTSGSPEDLQETPAEAADGEPYKEECAEPPEKISRLEVAEEAASTALPLEDQPSLHPRPPTPPETPEGGRGQEGEHYTLEEEHHHSMEEDQHPAQTNIGVEGGDEGGGVQAEEGEGVGGGESGGGEGVGGGTREGDMEEDTPEEFHGEQEEEAPRAQEEAAEEEEEEEDEKAEDAPMDDHLDVSEDLDASKESNALVVDHDSETPLEVDTEGDADADGDADGSGAGRLTSSETSVGKEEEEEEEEEQEDSAIDVTETSEPPDSDDKETDLNVSTESVVEVESPEEKTSSASKLVQTDEVPINLTRKFKGDRKLRKDCYVFTDNEEEEEEALADAEEERDEVGALDLSRHARSVRAQRESLESPPAAAAQGKAGGRPARGQGTQTILSITQSNKSKKLSKQSPSANSTTSPQNVAPTPQMGRPALPLEWTHSPIVPSPVTPHAVAFTDLMTLSQAAVQLQLAMAHAQAQAQVQAQAQAAQAQAQAEAQARAQAQVLKSLKASESLSFVNGSGDTLTISPIASNANFQDKAPKNASAKSPNKGHHSAKTSLNGSSSHVSHAKSAGSKSHSSHKSASASSNSSVVNSKTSSNSSSSSSNSLRTTKSLTASLKIPTVSVSKTNGTATSNSSSSSSSSSSSKSDRERDYPERTGDPVFKITNQKLAEFVRRQHLQQKLKQSNNNLKSSNTTATTTTTTTSSSSSSTPASSSSCSNYANTSSTSSSTTTLAKNSSTSSSSSLLGYKTSSTTSSSASTLSSSSSTPKSSSSQSIRATNTSVRQIPNPSLLRQQSESRITSGLAGLGMGSRMSSESISRIESLTRSLHEKKMAANALGASSLAATINSAVK